MNQPQWSTKPAPKSRMSAPARVARALHVARRASSALAWQFTLSLAAYNLIRISKLLAVPA